MAVWSSLCRPVNWPKLLTAGTARQVISQNGFAVRTMSSQRRFIVTPSKWQWTKFKDLSHFYFMVAAIPLGLLSLYCNVFIGPAQIAPIPEGYEPKEWEYHRHPISRFMVKYIFPSEQEVYEKNLHILHEEYDIAEINRVESEVSALQSKRQDYQHWYYVPVEPKYAQITQQDNYEIHAERSTPYESSV